MRLLAALLATAMTVVLAGCGASEDQAAGDAPAAQGGAFPVTVDHKYGSTTVESAPQKVVTLGLSDQDAALALGVKPVGVVDWFKERPYGKWQWTKDRWAGTQPEIVGEREDFNMEKIAALQPDLILAQYSGMTKEQYDTLSEIAPVVAQPKAFPDYAAPWQETTRPIGKALGQESRINELIAQTERRFADVRAQHPEFAQQTLASADSFQPGIFSAFTSTDAKAIFFKELGFKLPEKVDSLATPGANAAEFGAEQLPALDVDRLVWITSNSASSDRIKAEPLYQQLKVVQAKRDLFLPYQDPDVGAAISFNTVLSIPYAIDQVVPQLTAAK